MIPEHEVLDLGLVYYKNIVPEPQKVIDLAERLAKRFAAGEHGNTFTRVMEWEAWKEPHLPKPFNYKFYIWRHNEIQENDFYREDLAVVKTRQLTTLVAIANG